MSQTETHGLTFLSFLITNLQGSTNGTFWSAGEQLWSEPMTQVVFHTIGRHCKSLLNNVSEGCWFAQSALTACSEKCYAAENIHSLFIKTCFLLCNQIVFVTRFILIVSIEEKCLCKWQDRLEHLIFKSTHAIPLSCHIQEVWRPSC